ncbi:MAG TPA: hypothetical protein HA256_05605 [Methanoregulaceae archaeon]|jgi:hypothetical protein|nr:hypothetical protein [Methanoregulaceae archaeon]
MTGTWIRVAGVLLLLVMISLSGCVEVPKGSTDATGQAGNSGDTRGGTGPGATATQAPVTGFLTPATPFPAETTPFQTMSWTRFPDESPVHVEYVALYYTVVAFRNTRTAYSYNLVYAPLVIDICIKPNMTTRTIWYEDRLGKTTERTETITTISPNAWFEVTVRDSSSGNIVAKEGFARLYSVDTAKSLVIRSPGNYLIEFTGNDITAEIQIRVQRAENQTGASLRTLSCRP